MTIPVSTPEAPSILLVDDDPDIREALTDSLAADGFQVQSVGAGRQAIEEVREHHYGAVLLDVGLPDLDGISVLKVLRELEPTLPVIIFTAYTSTENTVGTLSQGAFAYLTKPYNLDEIRATLRRAVSVKHLAMQAKSAEEALHASEGRFRSVVEAANDAVILADGRGLVLSWNPAAERMFGYCDTDVIGQPLTMLMPARFQEAHEQGLRRVASGGESRVIGKPVELVGRRKDGSEFPLELSLGTWVTPEGTFYSGIIRDITERKRAEDALARLSRHNTLLLNAVGEGIYGLDLEGCATFVNPTAARLLGWEPAELLGRPMHALLLHTKQDGAPYPSAESPIACSLKDGARQHVAHEIFWRKDGTSFQVEYTSTPVWEQDRVAGAVVVFRDISEQKRAEEAERKRTTLIRAQEEALIELAKNRAIHGGDLESAFRAITEVGARLLGVGRSSIWLFNADRSSIRAIDLYEVEQNRHSSGTILWARDYPAYFQAVEREERTVSAQEAHTDPRTREFSSSYLMPLGIGAMLDAPIRLKGVTGGVLCHEHLGGPRTWTSDEDTIAASLATMVSLALEAHERKQTETALQRSEQHLKSIIETSPEWVKLVAADGALLQMNAAGLAMIEADRAEDVIGRCIYSLVAPEHRDAFRTLNESVCQGTKGSLKFELVGLRGTRRWMETHAVPLRNPTDGLTVQLAITRDITEQRRAEAALRASEERFRQVAENIREVIWMTDLPKGRMLYISPGYEAIWGRSCESLYATPMSWLDAIHPEDHARVREAALTKQVSGDYDEEYRIVRPDGAIRWIKDRAFPIQDESGVVYRIAGIAEDITERKTVEEAVRRSYEQLEGILACLPGSIFILNERQQVAYANPLAGQQFGDAEGGLVGRSLYNVLPIDPLEWTQVCLNAEASASDSTALTHDREFMLAQRTYRYRPFPLAIQGGPGPRVGLMIWEVTEQKQLQDQLIQAEKLASLGTLASGMAHEINNPMQGILSLAEIIQDEDAPQKIRQHARDIEKFSTHVATVIREFCSYARPSTREEPQDLDVAERLTDAVKMVQLGPNFGAVEVTTRFRPVPPIRGRRTEIEQVFVNLIGNAVQAMHGQGRLTLATDSTADGIQVRISDTGPGIPKAILGKIFDPFFTTKEAGKGTGLGLSIVQKILERYEGRVSVQSEEGKGATFTITFPAGG